jgi:hypothetical protein
MSEKHQFTQEQAQAMYEALVFIRDKATFRHAREQYIINQGGVPRNGYSLIDIIAELRLISGLALDAPQAPVARSKKFNPDYWYKADDSDYRHAPDYKQPAFSGYDMTMCGRIVEDHAWDDETF